MENTNYNMIFKRKSFHLFRNIGQETISSSELENIQKMYDTFIPLYPNIKTAIHIVPTEETNCKRGQEYCILLYSELKDNYLQNIGYLGEQLDLYLVSQNIGTLWFGIGKIEKTTFEGLHYVIMIAISKVDSADKFRKDMFKSKRKAVEEFWFGKPIDGVSDIVRFTPSSCNTQPWIVEHESDTLNIYRYKKAGKRGIMPVDKVSFYNQIDIGIFLCFLELCMQKEGLNYSKSLYVDNGMDSEKTLNAVYTIE